MSVYDMASRSRAQLESSQIEIYSKQYHLARYALRDHSDDETTINDSNANSGNFKALLQFRMESGDAVLKEHYQTSPKNAKYNSKTIPNELIEITGEWLCNSTLKEGKQAKFCTILADKVADVSNMEQLCIVL